MAFLSEKLISASGGVQEATDSDFNLVTSLYHFDTTTDNGNNSTFLDSSSESHTITNGSTPPSQGSFSPFSAEEGKWSVFLDGNGDYLYIDDSSDLEIGSSEFTMECWFFQRADSGSGSNSHTLLSKWDNDGRKEFILRITENSSNQVLHWLSSSDGSSNDADFYGNTVITNDEWHHAAATRDSSNTIRLFLDGVLQSSTASQSSTYTGTHEFMIGANGTSGIQQYMDGFISNVRFIKGTALYTGSSYTAPTAPLTAVTNTKLLTCCSNRYRDKSSSSHFIRSSQDLALGEPHIKPFSPFNPSEAYSASVKGGSAEFDQEQTTYLDITDSTDFDFGEGDFTVEGWVYPNKVLTSSSVPFALMLNGKGSNFYFGWTTYSTKGLTIYGGTGAGGVYSGSVDHVPKMNGWSHIVYQRTSGNFNFYLNGTRVCNVSRSGSFPDVTGVRVGASEHYGDYEMGAFLSDLRVVKGSNVYSNAATLTVPTAPLTDVTNTKLLLNSTNSVFFDSTGKTNAKFFSGSGLVRSKTAVKKFGTSSAQWTGTGAYLRLNETLEPNLYEFAKGDFTVEFQLRLTNTTSTQVFIDFRDSANSNIALAVYISSSTFYFWAGSSEIAIGTLSTNTWHHIAIVRSGSTITSYIDGTAGGTETNTNRLLARQITIGSNWNGQYYLIGYMDELRITNGKARYTSNFTAPTEAFLDR